VRGKDKDWVLRRMRLHRQLLISDAHHGYSERSAIRDIEEEVKVYFKKHRSP
jgi:hypothetical protein